MGDLFPSREAGYQAAREAAYQTLRAELRADPDLRPEWLDSTQGDKDPLGTILDLVNAVNKLQNELAETRDELRQAQDRIDALDGGDPMSRENY